MEILVIDMNKYLKFQIIQYIFCVSLTFFSCKCENNLNSTDDCALTFETYVYVSNFFLMSLIYGLVNSGWHVHTCLFKLI